VKKKEFLCLSKLTSSIIPSTRKVFNVFIISKLGSKSPLQDQILNTTIIYPKQIGGQIRDQTRYDIMDNFQFLLPTIIYPKEIGA
jgi:hypothetical protein